MREREGGRERKREREEERERGERKRERGRDIFLFTGKLTLTAGMFHHPGMLAKIATSPSVRWGEKEQGVNRRTSGAHAYPIANT